jgi:hypothetical protein
MGAHLKPDKNTRRIVHQVSRVTKPGLMTVKPKQKQKVLAIRFSVFINPTKSREDNGLGLLVLREKLPSLSVKPPSNRDRLYFWMLTVEKFASLLQVLYERAFWRSRWGNR